MNFRPQRIYAVGDVHGHHDELLALYGQLLVHGMQPDRDTLVFLGDYVDSGPDARRVVRQLIAWQRMYPHWVFLYGNHEDVMLRARAGLDTRDRWAFDNWWSQGGEATWRSYAGPEAPAIPDQGNPFADIDASHLQWVEQLAMFHETNRFIFVHAGLRPPYGPLETSTEDLIWIRDEFIQSDYDWGKRVIYGHTPVSEPLVLPNKICLNTFPRNQGKLTAVLLYDDGPPVEPEFFFQPGQSSDET